MPGDLPERHSQPRLELRLRRGRVSVGLGAGGLPDGFDLVDLEMEVVEPPADLDPGAGTMQLRGRRSSLVRLEVASGGARGALDHLLALALEPSGWPLPEVPSVAFSSVERDGRVLLAWRRPDDEARFLLSAAREARLREEPDAALRTALAGHAALAAGLHAEGEEALSTAVASGLPREEAREAFGVLAARARGRGDGPAERAALAGLVPVAPTGERPALLLRLALLDREAGDGAAARRHAEEARVLAPREPTAVAACLDAAREDGDGPAVVELLERLAGLEPDRAGALLLERARRLAALGRHAAADEGFREALARLPADRALADEHAALRRSAPPPTGLLPRGEPLETFAARDPGPGPAALALRDAALLALEQGDRGAALRCARRAHALSSDLAFAGPLLATLLHAGGSVSEALDLHRSLLDALPAGPGDGEAGDEDAVLRLVATASLAEEVGDPALAVRALDRLLGLRPHDADAALWRFRLDPDREEARRKLAEVADGLSGRRLRAGLLARAAAAARIEGLDRGAASALLLRALDAAGGDPGALAEVTRVRLAAARSAADPRVRAEALEEVSGAVPPGPERSALLLDAAAAFAAAGDAAGRRGAARAAFQAWPGGDAPFREALLAAAGEVDAEDAVLALRAEACPGEAAACHHRRAALLLAAGRSGAAARAFESSLALEPLDDAALLGLAEARAGEGDLPGAVAAARRASEVAAAAGRIGDRIRALEAGARHAAAIGDRGGDAAALLESLAVLRLADDGRADAEVLQLVVRAVSALSAAGEETRAASLRDRTVPPGGDGASMADLLRPLLASARSLAEAGELGAAYARLRLAREIDPGHLELTVLLARVAEKLGHVDESVALGEAWADATAGGAPAEAAARYRELAQLARSRLGDEPRAAALLEKATALEPGDPVTGDALGALRQSRRGEASDLLGARLARLRDDPGDVRAARAVAILSRELADGEPDARQRAAGVERALAADALARAAMGLGPGPVLPEGVVHLPAELRRAASLPGALSASAVLLARLGPFLEPLFPADLARHGASPADRLGAGSAPALHRAMEAACAALDGRPVALFTGRRTGLDCTLVNTRPPSALLGEDAPGLPPGPLAFHVARAVALATAGWALLGRFAPRDVLVLLELASRFAGGEPPPRGLPAGRAPAFIDALRRSVPPATLDHLGDLGPRAAAELATLDPLALAADVEATASRLALLHTGDLHGALLVLSRLPPNGATGAAAGGAVAAGVAAAGASTAAGVAAAGGAGDDAATAGPAAGGALALASRPDLADLARFALSDSWLELRGRLLGWA